MSARGPRLHLQHPPPVPHHAKAPVPMPAVMTAPPTQFARPTTTPTCCPQACMTTHLVQAIAAAANPPCRPNTACKTSTANPPPCCPNMARQDWDVVQDPANPPRPFNMTCKAPATTDPHATSTRRATPRHLQTQCLSRPL
ncbi:hypothetical protein EDB89DRAFT_1904081 [Lactarius sanguifluus]|nr:hypothetical protein EDB89DRAFT_1904081 [Lactarius sanguifluus]